MLRANEQVDRMERLVSMDVRFSMPSWNSEWWRRTRSGEDELDEEECKSIMERTSLVGLWWAEVQSQIESCNGRFWRGEWVLYLPTYMGASSDLAKLEPSCMSYINDIYTKDSMFCLTNLYSKIYCFQSVNFFCFVLVFDHCWTWFKTFHLSIDYICSFLMDLHSSTSNSTIPDGKLRELLCNLLPCFI